MTTPPLTDSPVDVEAARSLVDVYRRYGDEGTAAYLAALVPRLLDALATAREERDAAVTKAERWRNCFVCVECGRGKADEEGCCATCGRDVLIFEGGKLTRPLSHFYDRDAIETEADEVEAERDSLRSSLAAATARVAEVEVAKDGAYDERNRCVAAMARMAVALGWRCGLAEHPADDVSWDAEWRTIVFIDLPTGQASWHLHDRDVPLFAGLPKYAAAWDGHSTPEKYQRLASLATVIATARVAEVEAELARVAPVVEAAKAWFAADEGEDDRETTMLAAAVDALAKGGGQ